MTAFDSATAVRRTGSSHFDVTVDPDWFVLNGPNGGYVASLLLRPLVEAAGGRPARSLTVHYMQPAGAGAATVDADLVRDGRSLTFLTGQLRQGDRHVANALAVFGTGRTDTEFQDVVPDVPGPEELDETPSAPEMPPIAQRLAYRPVDPQPFLSGGTSEFYCWLRLREPRPVDPVLLATYADALVPAMLFRATSPMIVPTVDLTVHFRRRPATEPYDGWCLGHVRTRTASAGFVEEDCDIYDEDRVLLAQSRQLAIVVPLS